MSIWRAFRSFWSCFYRHRIACIVVGHIVVVGVLATTWVSAPFAADMLQPTPTMTGGATVATPHMLTTITAMRGISNPFPYGQCTWWASQRYFQLSGVYVPWTINADAYQWSDRARDFHWSVSAQPQAGAIVDLQANIQGASNLGHVGVVERVLSNGHVLASNMNWGPDFSQISDVEFAPGPGVTFITAR
ncbi:hypothetical protein ccbrp13_46000 [Ktedonobacteria bacterium brp13]|nr:hypothetical protein ccbrp13_46000 [Ktedonobacteria bacterium brp13]